MITFKRIANWYRLAQPHKGYLFGSAFSALVAVVSQIITAIPTANVITSLTNLDYNGAIFWLLIGFACTFVYYFAWHLNYKYFGLQCGYICRKLSRKMYDKIDTASAKGLSEHSVEKLMLIFTSNIEYIEKFADYLTYQSAYIARAIITIVIVMTYNIYIGLIMLAVVILLYYWYIFLTNKSQKLTTQVYSERDVLGEKLTDVINGRKFSKQLNIVGTNKEAYLDQAKKVVKTYSKRGSFNVLRKNWTYAILYGIITALTIWLAVLTSANSLTLTVYLIISPYLINIIDQATSGYEMLYELQRTDVSAKRIQTVLNMPDADIVSFSNNTTDNLSGSLVFSNVSYKDTNPKPYNSGDLTPISFEIQPNTITFFRGVSNCGKRSIFYLLRRTIVPTTGTITMDGINIYDFEKDTYKHNFSYTTSKPFFFNESILSNLSYAGANKKKIISVCKMLGIHNYIQALPNGYDTNLIGEADLFSSYVLYMIGLARSVLSKSEWICIYEFPVSLTTKEQQHVLNMLTKLKADHSLIIFSAKDVASSIADVYYEMQAGHIRKLNKIKE